MRSSQVLIGIYLRLIMNFLSIEYLILCYIMQCYRSSTKISYKKTKTTLINE